MAVLVMFAVVLLVVEGSCLAPERAETVVVTEVVEPA